MPERNQKKHLNSFRIVGQILAAAVGIRSSKDRGTDFTQASNAAWIGAILLFAGALYVGMRVFVYFVQRNVGA